MCVRFVFTAESRLRDSEDQFGRTPLMYCVLADRLDCAEVLLKAAAAVNKTDHSQRTALHLAAQKVTHTHTHLSVSELTLFLIDTYKFGVVGVYCPLVFVMLTYFLLRFKYESAWMCHMVF